MDPAIKLPQSPRILVITMRRLGDVLLTTPLVRAVKQGVSGAHVDVLVFAGTEGVLAGNPDIDNIITVSERPGVAEMVNLTLRLWRGYDIAISTQGGDRPTFLAWAAGRFRVGLVPENSGWKAWALDRGVVVDSKSHRVDELFRLSAALGINERPDVVVPHQTSRLPPRADYAVLHPNPKFRIRRWTDEGWRALATALTKRGLTVVVTGGPDAAEKEYLDQIWKSGPVVERMDGRLGWGELAQLMAGASVYVGPETSMTHLAAAAGCPTVGIYGPASPHLMGPWPVGGLEKTWAKAGAIQHHGNVWVVQNPLPCMPCDALGCERHLESYSACLDELPAEQVVRAVDAALGKRAA